ncbi:hypothetical protein C7293_21905 [filamentous cyanobacterium CCT1]|nr:hypothetical protein C7293_21905 [filamentous cyanobacterium CCT1]PSN76734.1 hypothetical protein C8B47_25765 [filamentous cyanobacterium CCP4]
MAQILDPLPSDGQSQILCCYVNATSKIQVARITNVPDWYFERVVFPGQRLLFETVPRALLEIHTGMMASAILSDSIPCDRLRVDAPEPVGFDSASSEELEAGRVSDSLDGPLAEQTPAIPGRIASPIAATSAG